MNPTDREEYSNERAIEAERNNRVRARMAGEERKNGKTLDEKRKKINRNTNRRQKERENGGKTNENERENENVRRKDGEVIRVI